MKPPHRFWNDLSRIFLPDISDSIAPPSPARLRRFCGSHPLLSETDLTTALIPRDCQVKGLSGDGFLFPHHLRSRHAVLDRAAESDEVDTTRFSWPTFCFRQTLTYELNHGEIISELDESGKLFSLATSFSFSKQRSMSLTSNSKCSRSA
jgi:hypothetical protein